MSDSAPPMEYQLLIVSLCSCQFFPLFHGSIVPLFERPISSQVWMVNSMLSWYGSTTPLPSLDVKIPMGTPHVFMDAHFRAILRASSPVTGPRSGRTGGWAPRRRPCWKPMRMIRTDLAWRLGYMIWLLGYRVG